MRVWAVVFVVVVFVCGIATGVAGDRLWHHHRGPPSMGGSRRPPQERFFEELTAELSLSAAQRTEIGAILDDMQRRARGIMEASRPALDDVKKSSRDRIVGVLTPEQQARFIALEEERGADRGRGPDDRGHGDRGPPGDHRGPPGGPPPW